MEYALFTSLLIHKAQRRKTAAKLAIPSWKFSMFFIKALNSPALNHIFVHWGVFFFKLLLHSFNSHVFQTRLRKACNHQFCARECLCRRKAKQLITYPLVKQSLFHYYLFCLYFFFSLFYIYQIIYRVCAISSHLTTVKPASCLPAHSRVRSQLTRIIYYFIQLFKFYNIHTKIFSSTAKEILTKYHF